MAPVQLTSDRGRAWARRVPTTFLTLGPALVAFLAIASVWDEPGGVSGDVAEVTSWGEFLLGVPIGAALAALLTTWFAPRPAAWVMAIAVLPPFFPDGYGWFGVVAWGWVGIVVLDFVLVLRQRGLSAWTPVSTTRSRRWRGDHHLGARLVAGIVLTAVIATCCTLWLHWRGEARELANRAVPVEVEVTDVDTFVNSVFVKIHGRTTELYVNDADEHPVGSSVVVYTDPTGQMGPYGAEDADPAGWSDLGIPVGAAAGLLLLVLFEVTRRRRRVETLAGRDDPGVRVLVAPHPVHDGLEVFAVDDLHGDNPLAFLPKLEMLVPYVRDEASGFQGGLHELGRFVRFLLGVPVHRLELDSARPLDPMHGLEGNNPWEDLLDAGIREASVVGLDNDGSLCVLRLPGHEHAMFASVRPTRDSWTVRTLWSIGVQRLLGSRLLPAGRHRLTARVLDDFEPPGEVVANEPPPLTLGALQRSARVGPPCLVLVALMGLPWALQGDGLGFAALPPSLAVSSFAVWWWALGRPRVLLSRWGLRLTYGWLDHLVLPSEITEVRRLAQEVVVELEDGEYYEFEASPVPDELARQSELDNIVTTVEQSRRQALEQQLQRWEPHWPRRLPSSATLVGVCVLLSWAVVGFRG